MQGISECGEIGLRGAAHVIRGLVFIIGESVFEGVWSFGWVFGPTGVFDMTGLPQPG